jgi:uncharacterized protein (TIGR02145 family)
VMPTTWYIDQDGDGLGDAGTSQSACEQPSGFVANSGDLCEDITANNWNGAIYENGACFYCGTVAGTVTFDTHDYTTVQIGDQCWFAENLRTTKYADGTLVTDLGGTNTDDSGNGWAATTEGAMCVYNDNASSELDDYGRLYNFYAASDSRNVCPTDWHVPSDAEWTTLTSGLVSEAGGKMKEMGTTHWSTPNTGATNESGFLGLPGGYRNTNGYFNSNGNNAYFWSSSASGSNAWIRLLKFDSGSVYRYYYSPRHGFALRCVLDLN